jgi:hypothetical protein
MYYPAKVTWSVFCREQTIVYSLRLKQTPFHRFGPRKWVH